MAVVGTQWRAACQHLRPRFVGLEAGGLDSPEQSLQLLADTGEAGARGLCGKERTQPSIGIIPCEIHRPSCQRSEDLALQLPRPVQVSSAAAGFDQLVLAEADCPGGPESV